MLDPQNTDGIPEPASHNDDGRLKIKYDPTNVDLMARHITGQMKHEEFFDYGGILVTVKDITVKVPKRTFDENGKSIKKEMVDFTMTGVHRIEMWYLTRWISARVVFIRWDKKAKKWVGIPTPRDVAMAIIAMGGTDMRPLRGIVTCPTIRRDGTLFARRGYDHATGYYVATELTLPHAEWLGTGVITRQIALKALKKLRSLFIDMPFTDTNGSVIPCNGVDGLPVTSSIGESVMLAMLMQAVLRPALTTVPCAVITAPQYGSGKTFSQQLVGAVVLGKEPPVLNYLYIGQNARDENNKMLKAVLMAGYPIVILDNVNGVLTGDVLIQMITQSIIDFRDFGVLKMAGAANNFSTVMANGINIAPHADLNRRVIVGHINPQMASPETKKFRHKHMMDEAINERATFIECVLAIVKAYQQAGSPPVGGNELNGFEDWSNLVRAPLMWLGCADPLGSREKIKFESADNADRTALLFAMRDACGGCSMPASEWIQTAINAGNSPLRHAIMAVAEKGGVMDARRLGSYFAANKQTPTNDGFVLLDEMDAHLRVKVWSVQRLVERD